MKHYFNLSLLLIIIPTLCLAWEQWNVEMVSNNDVSGDYFNVKTKDDIAYFSNGWGIIIMDISNPENPQELRKIPTEGEAKGIFLQDTLLYLCDGYKGLTVFSISDPLNPVIIGQCSDLPNSRKIIVLGEFAYVTNDGGGFNIIDVSNPENPEVLCYYRERLFVETDEIKVYENYAFVTKITGNHFFVFEISDPRNPELVDTVYVSDRNTPCSVSIKENLLYAVSYPVLKIYSLNNPENLEQIGEYAGQNFITGKEILFYEDYAILSGRYVYIIDISDPQNPEYVSETRRAAVGEPTITGNSLAVHSHYAFLADGIGRMTVLNIENPNNPETVWEYVNGREYYYVLTNGEYAYLVDEVRYYHRPNNDYYHHLVCFDVHDPGEAQLVSEMDTLATGSIWSIKYVNDHYLYATYHPLVAGIGVIDIEDPANPVKVNQVRCSSPRYTAVRGDYIYVGRVRDGISIYSTADPLEPELIREYDYIVEPYQMDYIDDLVLDGNYLYASDAMHGLRIYEFNGPEEMALISVNRFNTGLSGRLVTYDGYVYARSASGIKVISVDNPNSPEIVNQLEVYAHPFSGLKVDDGILYVVDDLNGIKLFSLEEPATPELIGYIETPGRAYQLDVWGNRVYVGDTWDFGIYDVSRAQGAWFIGMSEDAHNFGTVATDSSGEWSFTMTNRGRAEREISEITIDSEVFSCEFAEAFSLPSGADTSFTIVFTPLADSTYVTCLTIASVERRLEVELTGTGRLVSDVQQNFITPLDFALHEPFPNPFNSSTNIAYDLKSDCDVCLSVFDLQGREVTRLVNQRQEAGKYSMVWNAAGVPSGVYLLQFKTSEGESFEMNRKVVLLK